MDIPDKLIKILNDAKYRLHRETKSLLHVAYYTGDMLDPAQDYKPRMFKLALLCYKNELEDLISKLQLAYQKLDEAIKFCDLEPDQ